MAISNKLLYTYTSAYSEPFDKTEEFHTSLVFDTNRSSLWTQGQEFGYATHMREGRHILDTSVNKIVHAIYTNTDGSLSYDTMGFSIDASSGDFYTNAEWAGSKLKLTYGSFTNTAEKPGTNQIISYVWIDHTGKLTYQTAVLEAINENVDIHGEPYEPITITAKDKYTVISNMSMGETGSITYTSYLINTTFNGITIGNVPTGIDINNMFTKSTSVDNDPDDFGSYIVNSTYGTFTSTPNNESKDYAATQELQWTQTGAKRTNVVLTNVNLFGGALSYSFAYLPDYTVNSGTAAAEATLSGTSATNIVTNITVDANGKLHYTYTPIKAPITSISNATSSGEGSSASNQREDNQYVSNSMFVISNGNYVLTNTYVSPIISTTTGDVASVNEVNVLSNKVGVTTAGEITSVATTYVLPTKKYVDELIKSNDALRYCGTASVPSTDTLSLTHTTSAGPAHNASSESTPDTSTGAVYKISGVSGLTYLNGVVVRDGDMIISYSETASSTTGTGWNVINNNIDFSTVLEKSASIVELPPTQSSTGEYVPNSSTGHIKVVDSVNLDPAGFLTVTYASIYHGSVKPNSIANDIGVETTIDTAGTTIIQNIAFDATGHMFSYTYGNTTDYKVTPAATDGNQHSVLSRNVTDANGQAYAGTTYIVGNGDVGTSLNPEKLYAPIENSVYTYAYAQWNTYTYTNFTNGYNPVGMEIGSLGNITYVFRVSNTIPTELQPQADNVITFVIDN